MWEFEGHRKKVFKEDDVSEEGGEGGDVTEEGKTSTSGDVSAQGTSTQISEGGAEKENRNMSKSQIAIIDAMIDEILAMMSEMEKKLTHLKEIVKEGDEKKLNAFYLSMIAATKSPLMHGEWLEHQLVHLQKTVKGTDFSLLVNVMKECMRHMYPNIPIFPSEVAYSCATSGNVERPAVSLHEEGKSGDIVDIVTEKSLIFDKSIVKQKAMYKITSKRNDEGKRYWFCPYENCGISFPNQCTADSCLNKHLGLVYTCTRCDSVSHNYDSARNHKCFAYHEKQHTKEKMRKRRMSGDQAQTVEKKIKIEKKDDEGDDIIVIE